MKKKNCNPEWNEDLTLSIKEPVQPVKFEVYDKDTFSKDDKMGEAELDIKPFVESVRMDLLQGFPSGTVINTVTPSRQNCIAMESDIVWKNGRIIQDIVLRLRNVESGELELQLQWVSVPGSTAF